MDRKGLEASDIGSKIRKTGKKTGISRRDFIKKSVIGGTAIGSASSSLLWNGAIAANRKIVVTTMPGPRWEGALQASAAAYKAKNPNVDIEILVFGIISFNIILIK